MRGSKLLIIFIFIITALLGASAIWIGWRLSREDEVTPEESEAASEQVWNAERRDLAEYASGWQQVINASGFDFTKAKDYALSEDGARFSLSEPILTVDQETLYGRDLNYYMLIHKFKYYISSQPLPETELDYVLDILITDSMLLQEASDLGLVALDSDIFNVAVKDFAKRNALCDTAKDALGDKFVQKISFEFISIWYNNTVVPVSVETGKALAQQKINSLYNRLNNGTITMAQAGEEIKNDTEIGEQIDHAYQTNAYAKIVGSEKESPFFIDTNVEQALWALGEGQLSTVTEGSEAYFIIIKVNARSHGIEPSGEVYTGTDKMLDAELQDGESKSNKLVKE